MKKKRLWLILGAIVLVTPTIILCFLFLTADGETLDGFAASSRFIIRAEGEEATEVTRETDEHRLLQGFLTLANDEGDALGTGELPSWLYTVEIPDGDSCARIGFLDGKGVIGWKEEAYVLDYAHLVSDERELFPCLVRYGLKSGDSYIDAPLLEQSAATVYRITSPADLRTLECNEENGEVKLGILLYRAGTDVPSVSCDRLEDVTFDPSVAWNIFVNVECIKGGYRVQCSYEFDYRPADG